MDIRNLFDAKWNGRSAWTIDWIGNPYRFDIGTGTSMVDVYVSPMASDSGATGFSEEYLSVPFANLAYLNNPFERPRDPQDLWRPALRTRGTHFRLDISPRHAKVYSLPEILELTADRKSTEVNSSPPYRLGARALSQAKTFQVLAIPDRTGTDPLFCVISCTEIVRHFFCTSTHLAEHLMSGWKNLLWMEGCTTPISGPDIQVGLKRNLGTQVTDAATLSQYLGDHHFRKVVDSIRKSQQRVHRLSTTTPFQCEFPIYQDCAINVEATITPANTPLGYRFFVTRLAEAPRSTSYTNCWVKYSPEQPQNFSRNAVDEPPVQSRRPWGLAIFEKYPNLRTFVCEKGK